MQLRLNRLATILLLIVLYPIALVTRVIRIGTRGRTNPAHEGTIEGDPLAYSGERPLIIAVWASWATIWKVSTAQVIAQLKTELAGQCEFAYVECNSTEVKNRYRATVVPLVIIRHQGKEISRFVNVLTDNEIKKVLQSLIA